MIAISLFLCCTNELHTQAVQTVNVGIAFVEFGDADTNPDARGGVGYTVEIDNERQLDTSKYDWHFWYDFFFKHEGHVSHPDSVSHTGPEYWTGDYSLFYPMSVARWCDLNSSGRHKLAPFHSESRSYDGILNEIADGKIAWLRLDSAKQYYSGANFSYNNTLARDTRERLNSIQDTSGTPLQSYCDVVFIVYAGTSMYNLTAEDSTGRLWACVLSEKTTHPADDTLDYRDDFINFSLAAFTHEYIHAISDIYLDPAEHQGVNAILDYGYDKSRFTPWIGLSGMYTYGASNKPYHLDPWAKLLLGWIDHDMLGYGEYFDRELPVIDDETASSAPEVAVIPIDVPWDPADPVWYRGHYLIIENRRIPENGPDSRIVPGDSLVGGFLVWEYDDRLTEGERGGLTVVEADGRYDLKYRVKAKNPGLGPSIDDFWGDSTSLSTWSDHLLGLHDPDSLRAPSHELSFQRTIPRQITIRFGPYSASGSSNIIPYISGGKPTSNNPAATRNNNQRKLIKNSDRLTFVCTDYLGGDTTKPMICLHEMEENGQSWSSYEILSDVSVYDTLATEPWNPRIGNIVANPAIARIAEDWGVAWQEKVADSEYIVRFRKSGA
ncbi:MAG: hypothetical protein RBU27_00030, partial [Bacteroidota bacterium]|nr:hypothetical protein [Bacteroidota bacterium]